MLGRSSWENIKESCQLICLSVHLPNIKLGSGNKETLKILWQHSINSTGRKIFGRYDMILSSYHIISNHIISDHIISYHIISYHIKSNHIISYHIISYHIISYHIISYHIISYHIISYHIISYHIISYHIISYHIISYHIISYHIISYHIIYHINHIISCCYTSRLVLQVFCKAIGEVFH